MPSEQAADDRRNRLTVTLVVLLALFAATFPVTTVGAQPLDSDRNKSDWNAYSDGSGTRGVLASEASDRRICAGQPGPTGGSSSTDAFLLPAPNETTDLTVPLGDVAVVPLTVPIGEEVDVTVGSGNDQKVRLKVNDTDHDGRVTLLVNTYLAGNESIVPPKAYHVRGDDDVSIAAAKRAQAMDAGEYTVTVRQNGTVVDERRMAVTEPSINGVTAHRAVPQLFEAANASEIRNASDRGWTRSLRSGEYYPEVVRGETLLLRIDAPSLLGVLAAKSGTTSTERFLGIHEWRGESPTEAFEISGPCGGIIFPETVENGGTRVVPDYRKGAIYVLLDTSNLEGIDAAKQNVYLELASESRLNGGDSERQFETEFGVAERESTIRSARGNAVRLKPIDNASVVGETDLLPGSEITVNLTSRTDPTFVRTTTATVEADGRFVATVDLSNATETVRYGVEISNGELRTQTTIAKTRTEAPSTETTVVATPTERPNSATVASASTTDESENATRETSETGPGFGPLLALFVIAFVAAIAARQ